MALSTYVPHGSRFTPQTESIPGTEPNNGGGFSFAVDDWTRLVRFLVLGTEGGTYYATERTLTAENAAAVRRCLDADPQRAVGLIEAVSVAGRGKSNDPCLFALAMAVAHPEAKRHVDTVTFRDIVRTGTHLLHFVAMAQSQRGWGRQLRSLVSSWYADQNLGQLEYGVAKCRQRDGWSQRDVLRKAHPKTDDVRRNQVLRWVAGKSAGPVDGPIATFERLKHATNIAEVVKVLHGAEGASWEMIPSEFRTSEVWEALIDTNALPLGAMVRNLRVMTAQGISEGHIRKVAEMISDPARVRQARLHPISILNASCVYRGGPLHGAIYGALDVAFHNSFATAGTTGKRLYVAVDVSSSMGNKVNGAAFSAAQGSIAMCMLHAATERDAQFWAFAAQGSHRSVQGARFTLMQRLDVSPQRRVDELVHQNEEIPFGRTDCALPMLHALEEGIEVDAFIVYTDNETNSSSMHPVQALRTYRERTGIDAKLVVVGMTATGFSIADPNDRNALDVVGFDASAPLVMNEFIGGNHRLYAAVLAGRTSIPCEISGDVDEALRIMGVRLAAVSPA